MTWPLHVEDGYIITSRDETESITVTVPLVCSSCYQESCCEHRSKRSYIPENRCTSRYCTGEVVIRCWDIAGHAWVHDYFDILWSDEQALK